MSNLVNHARRELQLCGAFDEDPAWAQSLLEAVKGFASYGHSGGSASVGISALNQLLKFKALTPPTSDPSEWSEVPEEIFPKPTWQNIRQSSCFSHDGGKTYWDVDGVDSELIITSDDPLS